MSAQTGHRRRRGIAGHRAVSVRATLPRVPAIPGDPALHPDDLLAATGGRLLRHSDRPIRGGAVDSRLVTDGNLFAALPGEHTDGHRFLAQAAASGAAAFLVARLPDTAAGEVPLEALGDVTVVHVPDVLRALQAIAGAWRTRFDPLVVGVTGSIAKTSTKEAIAAVLATRWQTLKNEGNQNNEVGLPLTVLRMGPEHEAAVLEMGMYVGGEIRELAAIGRPRIGVVTAVQPAHLSRIGSIEGVMRAKRELVEALPPAADGGVAVLNADDARVTGMRDHTPARAILYGFGSDADVRATDVASLGADGMAFRLVTPAFERAMRIPVLGRLSVHNAAAAAAVGVAAGLTGDEIQRGLEGGWSAPHRMQPIRAAGITLIDDSYNSSPAAAVAALDALAEIPGRHVAVLGEMRELGHEHDAGHAAVGAAAAARAERVIVVDGLAGGAAERMVADPARAVGVADREAALALLLDELRPGDVVLVKASRGVALDVLVDELVDALTRRAAAAS